jgi:ubiquitin conjugation factor E4 B
MKLAEIKATETLMEDNTAWAQLDETTRKDRLEGLHQNHRIVKSYCLLANENLILFNFLSNHVKEPFMTPELVEKVAQMLNYFLMDITGPKSLDLKVKKNRNNSLIILKYLTNLITSSFSNEM